MPSPDFVLSVIRLGLVVAPVAVLAHELRCRFATVSGAPAVLVEVTLAVAWMVMLGEGLGLIGKLELWWLIVACWLGAGVIVGVLRFQTPKRVSAVPGEQPRELGPSVRFRSGPIAAGLVLWLLATQWACETADALGAGMTSFDSLWYHMPIAARFAQTGSVTQILFPEADPSNAYFPANSELLHGIGIIAVGNDFLSPLLNIGWLAVGLVASWCVGARWRVQWWTLCAGAALFVLPVLSTNEPGQALDDVVGLALLAVGLALTLMPRRGRLEFGVTALALGLAAGTKWTFLVPAVALAATVIWLERRRGPARVTAVMLGGILLTGGWWYLRDLIDTGSPLGLSLQIGPLHLPGAASPISNASKQSVGNVISHTSLWSSRFVPGLTHALGPLWPLLLAALVGGLILAAVTARREPGLAALGLVSTVAAVAYVFTPATAQDLGNTASFFTYDLRFLAPALEGGLLLLPPILAVRAPRLLPILGVVLVAVALGAQFETGLWPTQTARHVAFLAITAIAGLIIVFGRRRPLSVKPGVRALGAVAVAVILLGAGDLVERHYFHRRYLVASSALGQIYRWAQTIGHSHIALYGTVLQYPLYGATDSNTVTYLGQPSSHGGYQPIQSCARFQNTIRATGVQYLVLTPGPTGELPQSWTQNNPSLVPILHPTSQDTVFKVVHRASTHSCS